MTTHITETELPEEAAIVSAQLTILLYLRDDGSQGFLIHSKGDAPMTTYLGMTVIAQRFIEQWGVEEE